MLSCLAVAAGARIFFELAYDFLVIKGDSRWILYVQLGWLVVLVPALLVGAHVGGLRGVAVAQAVVAVLVVLPAYALLLRRVGLQLKSLARAVWPAAAIALLVGVIAWIIAAQISSAFVACLLCGLVCALGIGVLLAGNRRLLARVSALRRSGS